MGSATTFIAYNEILWLSESSSSSTDHIDFLENNGFKVSLSTFDEDWKTTLAHNSPAIILFDQPSDTQAVVQSVISAKIQTKEQPITTILLASEITPDAREKYFQAGGDDFIKLPTGKNEILSKIKHYSRYQKDSSEFGEQLEEASQMALLAMENSSDLGGILNFVKSAMKATDYETLANDIFIATSLYSNSALVEIKGHERFHYFTSANEIDSDMKRFMLSQKPEGRVIQNDDMIQINHQHLVLLLEGLPVQDGDKMGRISDTLVMLCDAANRFAKSLAIEENLTKAESSRRRFLTTLSHELRTPLNGILGFSKALRGKDEDKPLGKSGIDALGRIFESTDQINAIITTLIDISSASMGAQGLITKTFDIAQVALKLETEFKPVADEKGLNFSIDFPDGLTMLSDEKKFYSLIQHLVDNAIKFTDKGSVEITINTDFDAATGQRIIVTVRDTGIGIEAKNHKRIFSEVGQLNNEHNRRHYGVGLGLYYVNLVSQQLNGTVKIESDLGKGSCFTLDLPAGEATETQIDIEQDVEQEIDDLLF